MSESSEPDVVKISEVFLVPSSFLVAALGTADTNPHRAAVSVIGLAVGVFWLISSQEALAEWTPSRTDSDPPKHSRRIRILSWLPVFFIACWALSIVAHLLLWSRPLGH